MQRNYFDNVIGQEKAKRKLGFRLDTHLENGAVIPHTLFVGAKGDGKSYLVRQFAKNFPDPTDPVKAHKTFYGLNGGAIRNPQMLFEDIFGKTQGDLCTFFIDECHDLPKKVQTILLTVLEPTASRRTSYIWDGVTYTFDFRQQTFLFATTEEDKVFHALRDRLDIVSLEGYNEEQLAEIIQLSINGEVDIKKDLLMEMAGYIRRNARSADRLAHDILSMGVEDFSRTDWLALKNMLSILPKGLSQDELNMLDILASDGALTLGALASRMGRPVTAVQNDIETYLKALGFMVVDGKRQITPKGYDYLKKLNLTNG